MTPHKLGIFGAGFFYINIIRKFIYIIV